MFRIIGLLLAGLIFVGCGRELEPSHSAIYSSTQDDLKNFHQVDADLFRSAKPDIRGFDAMKNYSIKTVLTLEQVGDGNVSDPERAIVEERGMKFFRVPMNGFRGPTLSELKKAVSIIMDPANQPILVHCFRGSDRTGMAVGAYHITVDKWTADAAIADMRLAKYGHSSALYFWDKLLYEYAKTP